MAEDYFSQFEEAPETDYFSQFAAEPRFLERTDRQGPLGMLEDIGEAGYNFVTNFPGMIEGMGKTLGYGAAQAQTNPKRFAQNVGGTFGEYGTHLANLPEAFNKYAQTRGFVKPNTFADKLFQAITPRREMEPWQLDENFKSNESTLSKIWKSLHIPRPGEFNYAEGLGREPARFEKEAEADELIRQYGPALLASPGRVPMLMAQQFGAEENPYGPMVAPVIYKAGIKTLEALPGAVKTGTEIVKHPIESAIQGFENLKKIPEELRNAISESPEVIRQQELL